ncbi:DUF3027 domain-containing protein [Arthrobacter sp. NPDC092385]|uniref:DUF3027 domain-containing protein n=1 Tax=Arthrobacter sp. NPDC092385 TaxID=3363943 RepID=UPI00381F43A5
MTSSNLETAEGTAPTDGDARAADDAAVRAEAPRRPRAARRIPKTDAVLEAAVDRARLGVLEIAPEAQVGRHVSAVVEGERLVTHRFEAFVPGYGGWQWYASVARVARSKDVTVCEVGLLPSAASLLAPEWLPWSERVRPEDSQTDDAAPAEDAAPIEDAAPAEDAAPIEDAAPAEDAQAQPAGTEAPSGDDAAGSIDDALDQPDAE